MGFRFGYVKGVFRCKNLGPPITDKNSGQPQNLGLDPWLDSKPLNVLYLSIWLEGFFLIGFQGMCKCTNSPSHITLIPLSEATESGKRGIWPTSRLLPPSAYLRISCRTWCLEMAHAQLPSLAKGLREICAVLEGDCTGWQEDLNAQECCTTTNCQCSPLPLSVCLTLCQYSVQHNIQSRGHSPVRGVFTY